MKSMSMFPTDRNQNQSYGYPGAGGSAGTGMQSMPGMQPSGMQQPGMPMGHNQSMGMAGGGPNGQAGAAVDLVGPILRRKFLIALLMIVGGVIAFLAYLNATPIYESTARLMITTEAPPTVDMNMNAMQKVSIAKHQRLLTSQLVLSEAMQSGNFGKMEMFKDSEDVMLSLIEDVLQVEYSKKEDDSTLTVLAQGVTETELQLVLNSVITAYMNEIAKDSKTSGEESLKLVTQLRDQLDAEKKTAEEGYMAIWKKLNLPNVEQSGTPVNPYLEEMDLVKSDRNETLKELREVSGRVDSAATAIVSDDQGQVNYLATEAKKFLGVEIETLETLEEKRKDSNQNYLLGQYSQQVFAMEKSISELQIQLASWRRTFGPGHPTVTSLQSQISSTATQLADARKRLAQLEKTTQLTPDSEQEILADLEIRNRQWISIYQATLSAEKERLLVKLGQLDDDLAMVENQAKEVSADIMELTVLKSRIAEKQKGIDEVLNRLSEINVVTNNFTETKVRIIDRPSVAEKVAPSLAKYGAVGVLAGALLGVGLALLIDMADQTFRNPSEIFQRLKVPVVAKIPPMKIPKKLPGKGGISPVLMAMYKPASTVAEAIRAARTALFFAAQTEGGKVFLLTSPSPGDGKSTICANLAISIAQAGKKVVLVDADFRRPRVHIYFGQSMEPGAIQAVSGAHELSECLTESSQDNLTLLTAGGRPKNAGEIVTSHEFWQMIQVLREKFDFVLIDSPPLLPVSDAAVMSSIVDGVYLVMRIRKGVVVTSSKAKEKLDMVNANLLGVIVNGVDDNPHYNEYGSYGYGYGGYGYSGYGYGNGRYYESRNSKYQEKIAMKD